MLHTETIKLTPQIAAEFLKSNKSNRALSRSVVTTYAAAIRRNEWLLNGEAICLDTHGNLLQGQHRCHAVIAADKPIDVVVVRGVDPGAFKTYDQGKRRTVGDILGMSGEKNSNILAAACKAYLQLTEQLSARQTFTSTCALRVLERAPELRYWSNTFQAHKTARHLFTSQLVAVLCIAAKRHGEDRVLSFLRQLDSGVNLGPDSPALRLRDKFIEKNKGTVFTAELCMALYIKAINAHLDGKPMKTLRMTADEQFPTIV